MSPRFLVALCAVTALALGTTGAQASNFSFQGLDVTHLWTPTPAGNDGGVPVYGLLIDTGKTPITVVGVSSPDASQARFRIDNSGNIYWPTKIELEPGKSFRMSSWHEHIWLSGLKTPVKNGEDVPLVLVLADGRHLNITSKVQPSEP